MDRSQKEWGNFLNLLLKEGGTQKGEGSLKKKKKRGGGGSNVEETMEKRGEDGNKKIEGLENEKSFIDEVKIIFDTFSRAMTW